MQRTHPSTRRGGLVVCVLLVALLVAMAMSTKILTPQQVAAIAPKPFDPAQVAADVWAGAQRDLPGRAAPLPEVVQAFQTDLKSAAAKYRATSPNEGSYVFPVTVEATVVEATDAALRLKVAGVPDDTQVLVPVGPAVNGSVVRDVMGFKFADAPGQTDYQYVGDEVRKLMLAQLRSAAAPSTLPGKPVTLVGAVNVISSVNAVPRAKPVTVQPVTLKVGP